MGADSVAPIADAIPRKQTLQYGVEWRLVRAGTARLEWAPTPTGGHEAELNLTSAGLVSKLYRVNDQYRAVMDPNLCAQSVHLKAEEGKRRRETNITFTAGKVKYVERDLIKNNVALAKEIETPPCVHEYLGALTKLRGMRLQPGQSVQVPMTDGKKFANVRVEAEERETVRIENESYNTIRYEVHMFNEVLLNRKARMYMWITDDNRRLPVQLRLKLSVLVGTITLQLEKVE
jgi:hypothetical protein